MKTALAFILSVSVLLCAAAPADAQSEAGSGGNPWFSLKLVEHPWYFGVYGGYANNTLYQGGAENSRPGKIWNSEHGWTVAIPLRQYSILRRCVKEKSG
jgi:hypothetical protein